MEKDVIFLNSMIEDVNKRIKYDFLFPAELQNFEQTKKQLKKAVAGYNDKPYHPLLGLTPNEVFNGKLPDKAMFKNEIIKAKRQRIIENKANICFQVRSAGEFRIFVNNIFCIGLKNTSAFAFAKHSVGHIPCLFFAHDCCVVVYFKCLTLWYLYLIDVQLT